MNDRPQSQQPEAALEGLCPLCIFVKVVMSDRGSRFLFCERSKIDPRFPRYPRLPVVSCPGYERAGPAPDAPPEVR